MAKTIEIASGSHQKNGEAVDEAVQPDFHSQLSHELFLLYEV